mgnify:CR=1 FL=1
MASQAGTAESGHGLQQYDLGKPEAGSWSARRGPKLRRPQLWVVTLGWVVMAWASAIRSREAWGRLLGARPGQNCGGRNFWWLGWGRKSHGMGFSNTVSGSLSRPGWLGRRNFWSGWPALPELCNSPELVVEHKGCNTLRADVSAIRLIAIEIPCDTRRALCMSSVIQIFFFVDTLWR